MLHKTAEKTMFMQDAKKLNLSLDFDPDLPETVLSDEQRLSQVLDNFLSNAIKFTPPEGTITLSVKKLSEDETTCCLEIKVIDTGIGISAEGVENIFTLFEQADGGMARKYGGAGLGLAICANIVHLMGGKIQVESEPGKGSVFGFEVALEKGNAKKESLPPAVPNSDQKPRFAGISILLAEDVEINREIVISLLEDTGVAIDCAENGLQAVELYKAAPSKYRLVFMDVHMPEMDGYGATQQIRAFEAEEGRLDGVPIIAMTANVFKDDVEKCLASGMTSHVGKPIDFGELMKLLDRFLL
jgi:CheY-like chemotaxis protein